MKITLIMLVEASLLTSVYLYKIPYTYLILLISYLLIGVIHGRYFKNKAGKAMYSIVGVGVVVGILMTVLNFHIVRGESTAIWFLMGLVTNSVFYALISSVLIMYVPACIGVWLAQRGNSHEPKTAAEIKVVEK